MKLVFLDTETTGLNPERCEIWEIGAILRLDGQPDVEYLWQVRPDLRGAEPTGLRIGRYYQRSVMTRVGCGVAMAMVHPDWPKPAYGYDDQRLVTVSGLAAELATMLDGAYVVGAVPWFDERFLQRFLHSHGQAATNHYHLVDVETLAAGARGIRPPWGFDDLLALYGLRYAEEDRHTALGDARMARDLYDAVWAQPTTLAAAGPGNADELVERLREEYAQGALDQDRNPTEDGFVTWLACRFNQSSAAIARLINPAAAVVVLPDGTEVPVRAEWRTEEEAGMQWWSGTLTAPDLSAVVDARRAVLRCGRGEGEFFVKSYYQLGMSQQRIEFVGEGPAPGSADGRG